MRSTILSTHLPDVQISRVKMFALVKNPVSASDQFYIQAVENFGGGSYVVDTTAPIEDVNTTVGDIDGNQAYYEAFLANVGAAAGAFTDSFQISTAADLPTDTADIKLFVDGEQVEPGASTYTINTGTTPVQIELEEAFQSSTSSANIVVRWQKGDGHTADRVWPELYAGCFLDLSSVERRRDQLV
jgi:hypothetical protein